MHVCVFGAGASLAQPVLEHFVKAGFIVTAVCRNSLPKFNHVQMRVLDASDSLSAIASPVDALVVMQGRPHDAKLEAMTDEQWDCALEDNLSSVFRTLRTMKPKMATDSNVVVIGSVVGSTGGYGCGNYASAKSGLRGLVRSAALEWAKAGIAVNLLELGFINSGMGARLGPELKERIVPTIPMGRFGEERDVVEAIDFLCRTRYMTGNVLTLAGGLR